MSNQAKDRPAVLRTEVARLAAVPESRVRVVRSPYRICPLGAHVDHQLGEVTGMALDRALLLGFAPRSDGRVLIRSHNFAGPVEFPLDEIPQRPSGDWGDYARGAAFALRRHYTLRRGLTGVIDGYDNVGGLSSSAAVGIAYLLALEDVNELSVSARRNVELDRIIENDFIGLNNGILDQSTILLSRRDQLTYVDCQSGEIAQCRCGSEQKLTVVVLFSGLRRQLSDTDYNRRVAECERAAALLLKAAGEAVPPVPRLRHVDADVFYQHKGALPEPLRRRAQHFFGEQQRVRRGVELWRAGDLEGFGRLVSESGLSSIQNYECGNRYLRAAYEVLRETPGVLGARFSGAGFRGCCIGLAAQEVSDDAAESILGRYVQRHPDMGGKAEVYSCRPSDGAEILKSDQHSAFSSQL